MRRALGISAAVTAATLFAPPALAAPREYPTASICAGAWNRAATFSQKAAVARRHPQSAQIFARTSTAIPQCLVYFLTTKGTLFSSARLRGNAAARWTTPKPCPSPPAGILARVDRRGFIFLR